jgi:hypothetical protein
LPPPFPQTTQILAHHVGIVNRVGLEFTHKSDR